MAQVRRTHIEEDSLVSVVEVAKRLSVSPYTVRRLIEAGEIRAVRVGKRILIATSEVDRIIEHGCGGGAK